MNYISDLTSFSIKVPFLSQDPVQDTMLSSPPDCDSFSSLFFYNFDPSEEYWSDICKVSLNFGLSDVF